MSLDPKFFAREPVIVARELIGVTLLLDGVGGIIVETEAYDPLDPASHSFGGKTARNASMFGPPGCAYVYRSYGIHWCMNFVAHKSRIGGGVLIRALEPTHGIAIMEARRGCERPKLLCSGPGRLGQALAITRALDGLNLNAPPFALSKRQKRFPVVVGPRIGLSRGVETPWRFGLKGSEFHSRGFPAT